MCLQEKLKIITQYRSGEVSTLYVSGWNRQGRELGEKFGSAARAVPAIE